MDGQTLNPPSGHGLLPILRLPVHRSGVQEPLTLQCDARVLDDRRSSGLEGLEDRRSSGLVFISGVGTSCDDHCYLHL
jgi:hypothetical protein